MNYKIGDRVKATTRIDEMHFVNPNKDWSHAWSGDLGTIEYIDQEGYPTVRFDKTGTATVVGLSEIRKEVDQ